MMTARMFVSIPIAPGEWLTDLMEEASAIPGFRTSNPEQVHITLRFIGDLETGRIPDLVGAVRSACEGRGPIDIAIKGMGCFPNAKHPRVLWAGVEPAGELADLANRISAELDRIGIDYDRKPFKGHVTIARATGAADASDVVSAHRNDVFTSFTCDSVNVMRSSLTPCGAVHRVESVVDILPHTDVL